MQLVAGCVSLCSDKLRPLHVVTHPDQFEPSYKVAGSGSHHNGYVLAEVFEGESIPARRRQTALLLMT